MASTPMEGEALRSMARIISGDGNTRTFFKRLLAILSIPTEHAGSLEQRLKNEDSIRSIVTDLLDCWMAPLRDDQATVEEFLERLIAKNFLQDSVRKIREQVLHQCSPISKTDKEAYSQLLAKYGPRVISKDMDVIIKKESEVLRALCPLLHAHFPDADAVINKPEFHVKLLAEVERNPSLCTVWNDVEAYFNAGNRRERLAEFGPNLSEATESILRNVVTCYTRSFYYEFNEATRNYRPDVGDYPYPEFFNALLFAVTRIPAEPDFGVVKEEERYLYRGASGFISSENLSMIRGTRFAFQQFISTSTSPEVADRFRDTENKNLLWKIKATLENIRMAPLKSISATDEEEVLISPFVTYIVESVKNEGNLTVVQIKPVNLPVRRRLIVESSDIHDIAEILRKGYKFHPIDIVNAVLVDQSEDVFPIKTAYRNDKNSYDAYHSMLGIWLSGRAEPTFEELADTLREFHFRCAEAVLDLAKL